MLNEQGQEVCRFCGNRWLTCDCDPTAPRHFIGLDLSLTATGAVDYCPTTGEVRMNTFGEKGGGSSLKARVQRYDRMVGYIAEWLPRPSMIAAVCLEGYAYSRNMAGVAERVEMGGIIRHYLAVDLMLPVVVDVPPTTLKLFAVGRGSGKGENKVDKAVVRLAVYKRYGLEFPDDNQCDAYVLARIAACLGEAELPQTDFQKRAMEKVKP